MSAEQAEKLVGIREKIQSVKVRLQEQKDRYRELEVQNEELQNMVQQKQSQIKELEERNQKLALVKTIMAESGDAGEARIRINRIVREIDRCIALLNRS
jgi:predicted  nucleic acid-binding Zn-ribbon protein